METTNASSFFQTEEATKNAARQVAKSGNTLGNPLVFSTKILSVTPDRSRPDSWVYITESGSVSQETNIETGEKFTLKGHIAPVTCLEVFGERIYTASWDKTIRIYDKASRRCLKVLQAHTDFVKCMLMVPHLNILLSGSSDRCIKAWDLDSYDCLYTLKSHPRGIESLALSPSGILYSAGSESSIRMWNLTRTGGKEIKEPFWGHDTSVYRLLFAEDTLWTASADKTARQWTEDLKQEMRFEHPDYVRDVLVHHNYLITACRDENIRFFDIGVGPHEYTAVSDNL